MYLCLEQLSNERTKCRLYKLLRLMQTFALLRLRFLFFGFARSSRNADLCSLVRPSVRFKLVYFTALNLHGVSLLLLFKVSSLTVNGVETVGMA